MLKFKRVTEGELRLLLRQYPFKLRNADAEEIKAGTGKDNALDALLESVKFSTEWIEVCVDEEEGEVVSIFGLGKADYVGVPWMVGSPLMLKYKKVMMAYSRKVIASMLVKFEYLANYVDSRNKTHTNWLRRMGFRFPAGVGMEVHGVWFDYFCMRRDDV